MKISELIKILEENKKEYGDVVVYLSQGPSYANINHVFQMEDNKEKCNAILLSDEDDFQM